MMKTMMKTSTRTFLTLFLSLIFISAFFWYWDDSFLDPSYWETGIILVLIFVAYFSYLFSSRPYPFGKAYLLILLVSPFIYFTSGLIEYYVFGCCRTYGLLYALRGPSNLCGNFIYNMLLFLIVFSIVFFVSRLLWLFLKTS